MNKSWELFLCLHSDIYKTLDWLERWPAATWRVQENRKHKNKQQTGDSLLQQDENANKCD